jgi:hypothetical protein
MTIKRFFYLAIVFFAVISCCKKDELCHQCALSDGTQCPNNQINVYNNCQCPEGHYLFGDFCVKAGLPNTYIGYLNCFCIDQLAINIYGGGGLNIGFHFNGNHKSFSTAATTYTDTSFVYHLIGNQYSCAAFPVDNYAKFVGNIVNDSLHLNVYWYELFTSSPALDSCVNIVLAPQ